MARSLPAIARIPWLRLLVATAALLTLVVFARGSTEAQSPPPIPDFTTAFGQVQLDGANISPSVQTVIAFMNGHSCGWGTTQVASNNPDNPPGDVGKTVYVVDARAAGTGPGQLPDCGSTNDSISFYLPEIGRLALEQTAFKAAAGFVRVDLSLGAPLSHRLSAQLTASDGIN